MKRFSLRTALVATLVLGLLLGVVVRHVRRQSNFDAGMAALKKDLPALNRDLAAWKQVADVGEERFASLLLCGNTLSVSRHTNTRTEHCLEFLQVGVHADQDGTLLTVLTSRADAFAVYLDAIKEAAMEGTIRLDIQEVGEYRTALAAP